ncbi:MAG: four helix bundle protein [Deltaproteobacteria bacterium]|nr:four helix bundle protein [Deltaproteobacteria bacterium]
MRIFEVTKSFPQEEKNSLTDQIRRSSRSVCSNLAVGWYKRRDGAVFVDKLSAAGREAAETRTWLEFALACHYINAQLFDELNGRYEHISATMANMEQKAESFYRDR